MPGTGATITFIRKRVTQGDRHGVVVSILASAASFNLDKNTLHIKKIDYFTIGHRSFTSGDVQVKQNLRSGTTAEAGTIWGNSFASGDEMVIAIFGT